MSERESIEVVCVVFSKSPCFVSIERSEWFVIKSSNDISFEK